MGADLSFERPKCRYPNPNNNKNQVGPSIVKDPYKNKRGQVGINVSNPELEGILSQIQNYSPEELQSLAGSLLRNGKKMNPEQISSLMSMITPRKEPLGNSNNSIHPPPIPLSPPPNLPNENENVLGVKGGSKEKSVKDLRKICKRKKIKITKNGKYLTKKELLKMIHQSW